MGSRIVVIRALFDKLMKADPMLLPPNITENDVWAQVKNFVESEKGFIEVVDFVVNR